MYYEKILEICCSGTGISEKQVRSKTQRQDIVAIRHAFCYLTRKFMPYTYQSIIEFLNRKNHTTVINAIIKTEDRIYTDRGFKNYIEVKEVEIKNYFDKIKKGKK